MSETTREVLLESLSVPRWADDVLAGQPYADQEELLAAADRAARELTDEELDQALSGHPRIGERGDAQSQQRAVRRLGRRRHGHPAQGGQRGLRGAVRPGLPDPRGRPRRRRDPGRARPAAAERRRDRARRDRRQPAPDRPPTTGGHAVTTLSTHVLDTTAGRPAAAIRITLESRAGDQLAAGVTDADGRVSELGPERLEAGDYVLRFDLADYVRLLPRGGHRLHRRRPRPALPRAAAAQPVRLLHLPWQLTPKRETSDELLRPQGRAAAADRSHHRPGPVHRGLRRDPGAHPERHHRVVPSGLVPAPGSGCWPGRCPASPRPSASTSSRSLPAAAPTDPEADPAAEARAVRGRRCRSR